VRCFQSPLRVSWLRVYAVVFGYRRLVSLGWLNFAAIGVSFEVKKYAGTNIFSDFLED